MKKLTIWLTCLIFILSIGLANAQMKTITGTVTSSQDGLPIPGVTIIVPGTTIGTTTNFDGYYIIEVEEDVLTLRFQYVGMITQNITIGNSTVINIVMEEDIFQLQEVIIVAYGTSTKESFTGSAQVINAEKLESRALTSVVGAIEGSTSGVQVLSNSGQPGSSTNIVIRGVGTLNGVSNPLYVVDGIQYEGALASINTEDILSLTILKDAASTSLYGSRAANGVVIITTKSGSRTDGLKFNASIQKGFLSPGIPFYEAANPGQYYELMWEAYKNALISDGYTPTDAAIEASNSIYNRLGYNPFNVANDQIVSTNGVLNPNARVIAQGLSWYDELQRVGERDNYSFNISAGNKKYDVYFSTAYLDEKGYIIESEFNRLTSRINANFNVSERLKIGGSLNMSISEQSGPFSRGTAIANPFYFAKSIGSIYPVYIINPTTGEYILDAAGEKQFDLGEGYPQYGIRSRPIFFSRHAVAEVLWNDDSRKTNDIGARYDAELSIIEGLKAKINYGIDINDYIEKAYENNIVGDGAPTGRYREIRFRRTVKNFTQLLTYNKIFDNGHNVDITLGHENFDRHYSQNFGVSNTQTVMGIYEFDNFSTPTVLSGYSSDKRTEGYFARINYSFNNKYYFSASARRDGSSVFYKDVRWGNFYSVGASWRIDQEPFIKNINFINHLKLRASFGEVGQDNLNDFYISQPRYSLLPNAGEPGIFWSDLGNNELTWETTESWDIALDFALFNNKIEGSFEFYKKNSSDLLYNVPLPISIGLNAGPANIATMYNQGIEFTITTHIINNKDFTWDLTILGSTLKNKITDIPDPFISGSHRWDEGRSRFDYFVYHYAGVDPTNGDALYYMWEENVDGEIVKVLNPDGSWKTTTSFLDAGRGYADATSIPDIFGSTRHDITYKNFTLSILVTGALGGKILDAGYAHMMHEGEYGSSLHPDLLKGWRNPGDKSNIPRMENGNPNLLVTNSTRFLTDGWFFAFKNVSLSYNFNEKIIKKIGINSMRIFINAENLFLKSARKGMDPQYDLTGTTYGRDYNPSRIISAGVNISL